MSVTGNASSTDNLKVLKGKIASLSPYAVDPTLKVEGSAAEAKAVGDALEKKVAYTDIVDNLNTSDADKPLSAKQGATLKREIDNLKAETEETVTQTQTAAEKAVSDAMKAQNSAESAQEAAEIAQSTAEERISPDGSVAMVAHLNMGGYKVVNLTDPEADTDGVNKRYVSAYVNSRRFSAEVTLKANSWATTTGDAPYFQTVSVEGVTEDSESTDVLVSPKPVDEVCLAYSDCRVILHEQRDNEVVFKCSVRPTIDLAVNLIVFVNAEMPVSTFGLLKLNEDESSAAVMCSVGDEDYGVTNATVNDGADGENYDFKVL